MFVTDARPGRNSRRQQHVDVRMQYMHGSYWVRPRAMQCRRYSRHRTKGVRDRVRRTWQDLHGWRRYVREMWLFVHVRVAVRRTQRA